MIIRLLVPLALFTQGVSAGVMLGNAIGPGALALRLSYGRYVDLIKFMWPRYDPMLPIMNGLAFASYVIVAVGGPRSVASVLFGLSAALLAVLMVISLTKNVPINKYVTALDPANPPDDWAERDPRADWARWNRIRVALSLAGLVSGLAGAATLL